MSVVADRDAPAVDPPVAARGVGVVRDGRRVLSGVGLEVRAGEWLGLIGPNGAGKTTLLAALAGLLPASGHLRVRGVDPRSVPRRVLAREVALVPQSPAVPDGLAVTDYVLLGRTPYIPTFGVESGADMDVVDGVLRRLDLRAFAERPVSHLSGGEFQRVVLARALAQQAPVLLLDEPTSSLDVGREQEVLELVDALRRSDGLTVVAAMHDLTVAGQFADHLALLHDGRLVESGRPTDVLTEATLSRYYDASVRIVDDGAGGVVVVPRRPRR